jgi:transglutaminase-like putative cysteine protease
VLSVAVATATAGRVFESGYSTVIPVLAAVGAGLVAVVNPFERWPARVEFQLAYVLVAVAAVVRTEGGSLPGGIWDVARSGFSDILSARWPAPVGPAGAGLVAAVGAIAAAVAAELAWTRRFAVALLAPPLTVLGVLALLGAPGGAPSARVLATLALLAVAVLRLAVLSRSSSRRAPDQITITPTRLALAAAAVAVGVMPLVVAPLVDGAARFDPRDDDVAPEQRAVTISPLARLEEWRSLTPPEVMFSVDGATEERWRVVALPRFDGRAWMPADDFRRAGRDLAVDSRIESPATYRVRIESLDLPFLPTPDVPLRVSTPVATDEQLSGLFVEDGIERGVEYEVVGGPLDASTDELIGAPSTELASVLADPAQVSPEIKTLASEVVGQATTPFERAQNIAAFLLSDYTRDDEQPPGHTLGVIQNFLFVSTRGRDEQFVASFALLADAVGLPVRVAVGFILDPGAEPGVRVARSDRATAWPEVYFEGVGWYPFDPVPAVERAEPDDTTTPQQVEGRSNPAPPTTAPAAESVTADEDQVVQNGASGLPGTLVRVSLAVGLVLLAAVAYVAGVLALKRRRRLRRYREESNHRCVAGAFLCGVDTIVDMGVVATPAQTNLELLTTASAQSGPLSTLARELEPVATAATAAVYDTDEEPGVERVDYVWQELDRFEHDLQQSMGWWRWLRARLSTRSLRWGLPES